MTNKTDLTPERFLVTVQYDGTDYGGWQIQTKGLTIQGEMEGRLSRIFKQPITIHASGRTDAGVHSVGQRFHFDAFWPHPTNRMMNAINTGEQAGLLVTQILRVPASFHARSSSRGKRYRYEISLGYPPPWEARYCLGVSWDSLDIKAMRKAAKLLLGRHDFRAYGATHGQGMDRERPIKTLHRLEVRQRGKRVTIITEASGYLYKMVRRLVGGLLRVGEGRMPAERLLSYREEMVITAEIPTAPARGLFMDKVFYDPKDLRVKKPKKSPKK